MRKVVPLVLLMAMLVYPAAGLSWDWTYEDKDELNLSKVDIQWLNASEIDNKLEFQVNLYDGQGAANPTVAVTFFDTDNNVSTGKNITGLGVYGADKVVIVFWWKWKLARNWHGAGAVFNWSEDKWEYDTYLANFSVCIFYSKDLVIVENDSFTYQISNVGLDMNVVQFTSDLSSSETPSNLRSFFSGWATAGFPKLTLNLIYNEGNNTIEVVLSYDSNSITAVIVPADKAPDGQNNPPIPELPAMLLVTAGIGITALIYRRNS